MSDKNILWQQDGVDSGWWWFLPAWLPDTQEHDVGPFKTKTAALAGGTAGSPPQTKNIEIS